MPNINPALAQGAQDVPPDPSPGQGGQPNDDTQSANSPAPEQGQQSGQAGQDQSTEPRTPDNVRGEILRKMDQRDAALDQRFARLEGMLQGMANQPAPAPQPSSQPARIEDMSSQDLEALRPQVPEDKRPDLDRLITQRRIDESIANGIDQRLSAHQRQTQRVESNQTAYARWPELRDAGSQLYQMANHVLNERGEAATQDPRALLDAANEAGMRLGLTPKAPTNVPSTLGVPSGTQPPGAPQAKGLSAEEAGKIAQRLRGALPAGKEFNMDEIQKSSALYEDNRDLIIRQ